MASNNLTINIISPEGPVFEGNASCVFLPGRLFPFEVLPGHAAIISTLSAGLIRVVDEGGKETSIKVKSGAARVKDNIVTVCVEL